MDSPYDADYYLNGASTGRSNYTDYRWLPELTLPMARLVMMLMGIQKGDRLLDFGAARGYFVKAMRKHGVEAWGVDVSQWAVDNCDPAVKEYMSTKLTVRPRYFDYIWCKDVLEHIEVDELCMILSDLSDSVMRGMFFIVPLAESKGGKFICPHDEQDPTHVNRYTMEEWLTIISNHCPGFSVFASYHVPVLKKVSEMYPRSTAFIHAKRLIA